MMANLLIGDDSPDNSNLQPPFQLRHLELGRLEVHCQAIRLVTLFQPSVTHLLLKTPLSITPNLTDAVRSLSSLHLLECSWQATQLFSPSPDCDGTPRVGADRPLPSSTEELRLSFREHSRYSQVGKEMGEWCKVIALSAGLKNVTIMTSHEDGSAPPEGYSNLASLCASKSINCSHIFEGWSS